jgi:alkylation response protein AidB-like acyl-CoA dehydrogenase
MTVPTADSIEIPVSHRDTPYVLLQGGGPASPDRDDLIARAAALVPLLRERAADVQELRRLPESTVDDLHASGLLKLTRPREFGGFEVDQQTLADVIAELATGCGSTAWVVAIVNAASFIGGAGLPAAGSREMFASGEPACSAFSCRKGGEARPVEGGYLIEEGEWPWASGSQIAGWAVPRATLLNADGKPVDSALFLAPMSDLEVLDEWNTVAMRGTASNVLRAENLFVPEHRVGRVSRVLTGEHLGDVPECFRSPWISTIFLGLGPVGLGLARAALEYYIERVDGKPLAFTSVTDRGDLGRTHAIVGEASQYIDAASMLIHRGAAILDLWRVRGEQAPLADRLRIRADLGMSVSFTNRAIKMLYEDVGASAIMQRDPLSIVARDAEAVVMHGANNPATNLALYGAAVMGKAPAVPQFGPILMA